MQTRTDRRRRSVGLLGLTLMLLSAALPAQGVRPERYPMSGAVVAQALKMSGLDVKPSEVHLPMALSAASPLPELEITATQRLANGRVRLQLRCRKAGECLPFDATLDVRSDVAAVAEAGPQNDVSREPATMGRSETVQPVPGSEAPRSLPQLFRTSALILHAGSHVVLVLKDDHMSIHLPVIALDSGMAGAGVRVCTPDRKKEFHATVVDQATVLGVMR